MALQVKQPEPPIDTEVLAEHVVQLSNAARVMLRGRLRKETIVLLLHDYTHIPKRTIAKLLDALPELKDFYLKPVPVAAKLPTVKS